MREHYRKRYRYVLVDEYQDTNQPAVRDRARRSASAHANVCVVGDDDQSIYGWRGADVRKILGFERDFPGAKRRAARDQLPLDAADPRRRQRRDPPQRRRATRRRCDSARGAGEPVRVMRAKDETAEAQLVGRRDAPAAAARGGAARGLRDPLPHPGAVPAVRGGAARERAARTWWSAACRSSTARRCATSSRTSSSRVNPHDETALLRVINTPARGVGKASLDRVLAFATEHGISASQAFERAAEIEGLSPQAVEGYRALRAIARRVRPRRRRTRPRRPARALPRARRLPRRGRRASTPTR